MSRLSLVTAYVVSAGLLIVDLDLEPVAGAPHLALAMAPWVVLAGLPRGAGRGVAGPAAVAACLPPLALAARLDVAAGSGWGAVLGAMGPGLVLIALLVVGADAARERRATLHGGLWIALVVLAPLLTGALGLAAWAGLDGPDGVGPGRCLLFCARLSPAVWCLDPSVVRAAGPALVALVLLFAGVSGPDRGEADA